MGFLIPELHLEDENYTFQNAYASIADNPIEISKYSTSGMFYIKYSYHIWYDLNARIALKDPICSLTYSYTVSVYDLLQNIYTLTYNDIKQKHPEYIDYL